MDLKKIILKNHEKIKKHGPAADEITKEFLEALERLEEEKANEQGMHSMQP